MAKDTKSEAPALSPEEVAEEEVAAEFGQYHSGLWQGFQNYGCPHCEYKTLGEGTLSGTDTVQQHINQRHPTMPEAVPAVVFHPPLLGPDGELLSTED